ncbi:hypothetical protein K7X08_014881 [Anisodus acutangulus]|uniref:Uncharacterized protein n=1 Tax=Anisodus acutangulus TaxID=402998 RepID=A0A9Q1LLY8_9SOLA|nr:hypothetical protein K7X08_014881 [Anisodus acutangulus]
MNRMIQFPSRNAYDASLRAGLRKSRLFRMERLIVSSGTLYHAMMEKLDTKCFEAKKYNDDCRHYQILLQGVPRNALADDVERFLAGCQYNASSIQMFARQQRAFDRPPARTVLVEFPSQALATHAFITKNRGFCLNNQVAVRLFSSLMTHPPPR